MDTNPMQDCNAQLPGVNAPDPATCRWCGEQLAILHYHYNEPYATVLGYADRYDCHCTNEHCDAFMATGAVTTYPYTASRIVQDRRKKRSSNRAVIDAIMAEWLRELATTRSLVK